MPAEDYFTNKKCFRKSSKSLYKWKRKDLVTSIERIRDYLNQTNAKKEDPVTLKCKAKICANYKLKISGVEPFSFTYLAMELRKCLLSHDWRGAAKLIILLLDGPKFLMPLLWRSCIIILKNHPSSSKELLNEFVMKSTGSSTLLEESLRFKEVVPFVSKRKNKKKK